MCFLCLTISRITSICTSGGTAISTTSTLPVGQQFLIRVVSLSSPCRSATRLACAGVREAIATGLNPAWRYATRWQSAMMNPLPMQPIGGDLSRGRRGR